MDLLDICKFCSVVFIQISQLVIYHFFCLKILYVVKYCNIYLIFACLLSSRANKKNSNHRFLSIQSRMKQIIMIPIQCVFLECWRNNNFILTSYRIEILVDSSTKRTAFVFNYFQFNYQDRVFPLILVNCFKSYRNRTLRQFSDVIYF